MPYSTKILKNNVGAPLSINSDFSNCNIFEEQNVRELLSIYDYIKIAKDEENAIAIESLKITRTAIELNDMFQSYAIPEYEERRPLLNGKVKVLTGNRGLLCIFLIYFPI